MRMQHFNLNVAKFHSFSQGWNQSKAAQTAALTPQTGSGATSSLAVCSLCWLCACLFACWHNSTGTLLAIIQAARISLWQAAHLGTENEHQILNDSHHYLCLLYTKYRFCLVPRSNMDIKWYKMKRENNPIRLPLETWCSLTVPQCAASNKGTETIDACIA